MPSAPKILPTQIQQGSAPGVTYRLEGALVPVLHMALDGQVPVYFEHHVLLWKYPQLQIGLHPLKKGLKRRVFGGMPLLLLQAQSPGEIAFSRDAPGHIVALHLQPGEGVVVREHLGLPWSQDDQVRLDRLAQAYRLAFETIPTSLNRATFEHALRLTGSRTRRQRFVPPERAAGPAR